MKQLVFHTVLFWIFLLIFAATFTGCDKDTPQPQAPITSADELTQTLNGILQTSEFPGFAVSVVQNDEVVYQQAFGQADIAQGKPYTNETVQPIGSISKTFIGAALVKAIEQGYFELETDINEILPFALYNPNEPDATIRVEHLVTHTSGLLDDHEYYLAAYYIRAGEDLSSYGAQLMQSAMGITQRETVPLGDFLQAYYAENGAAYSPLHFSANAPGTEWAYSNLASSLSAYLIEVASGQAFSDFTRDNILLPLGMDQSSYEDEDGENRASLYWDKTTALPRYGLDSYPDGSLYTSNTDLAKYLLEMMRGYRGTTQTLFPASAYEMLFKPRLPHGMIPAALGNNQGIFWFWNGDKLQHDGSDPGTTCLLEFDTSSDTGFLLLTNADASSDEHELQFIQTSSRIREAIDAFLERP